MRRGLHEAGVGYDPDSTLCRRPASPLHGEQFSKKHKAEMLTSEGEA
jgi:hypothetical protein